MTTPDLHAALSLINQLSSEERWVLLRTLQEQFAQDDDNWALEGAQLAFMLQHHDEIEAAYENDDMAALDTLEASGEYHSHFGDMPWDEAYDRYEETWWAEGD